MRVVFKRYQMQKGGREYAKKIDFNGGRCGVVPHAGVSGVGSGND
jgi:hypothetical protein